MICVWVVVTRQFRVLFDIQRRWVQVKQRRELEERKKQGQILISSAYRKFSSSKRSKRGVVDLETVIQYIFRKKNFDSQGTTDESKAKGISFDFQGFTVVNFTLKVGVGLQ